MTIRQQISLEIEKASPEMLAQLLEFIQFLKQRKIRPTPTINSKHFLGDLIGILDKDSGDELDEIVNREFQKVEGEW